ncbi:hypothetical protein PG996_011423 [Apiospora saccharicola]|uniref:Uncharacterized protein n=1 Tax=Apiospora saccharicola TaxID=335842 RepID=A0ABR1UH96_9PEZI
MRWVSKREASRIEDEAYSLLRIFDVNMSLLYGEGPNAFQPLQHKILKQSEDCTLLLWNSDAIRDLKMTKPERGLWVYMLKAYNHSHVGSASIPIQRGLLNCAVQSQQRDDRDDRAFLAIALRPRSILDKSYEDINVRLGPGFFVIANSDLMNRDK